MILPQGIVGRNYPLFFCTGRSGVCSPKYKGSTENLLVEELMKEALKILLYRSLTGLMKERNRHENKKDYWTSITESVYPFLSINVSTELFKLFQITGFDKKSETIRNPIVWGPREALTWSFSAAIS